MPEQKSLVINTGPILALVAATGNLNILKDLYSQVLVTREVKEEICFKGDNSFGMKEFLDATFLIQNDKTTHLYPYLKHSLDKGEASVIQYAINNNIQNVCIDEVAGRRLARLHDLQVTGSLGIMIKAKKSGYHIDLNVAIYNMKQRGIFLSDSLIKETLRMAGDSE